MKISVTVLFLFFATTFSLQEIHVLQMAQTQVSQAMNLVENSMKFHGFETKRISSLDQTSVMALNDCSKLYEESGSRLSIMMSKNSSYTKEDALIWVSSIMTNHKTCLDGLMENGHFEFHKILGRKNLTEMLGEALVLYSMNKGNGKGEVKGPQQKTTSEEENDGLLESWNPSNHEAHFTVAQDGSGSHITIREAVEELESMGHNRPERVVIHVKEGVYHEKVEIGYKLQNVMFVGDGIDKTIVTGNRNVDQGSTTYGSGTFDVNGDGFWARDMTFENTAGPEKHQAVALKVNSDFSVFYRCSFKGYQDTLYVHSNRQFYRDCQIYGTIDFIFGDAAVVLQNCDIFVRKPMNHQSNFITAQGRDDPNKPTGISILNSRVRPTSDLEISKDSFESFLGRPWKKYSRTVILKTDLDGLIHPKGWGEWEGKFALSTLYYGEYMNTGNGASTQNRVNWPGFHVLGNANEASKFTVTQFLQGDRWIPASGVPFWSGI